MGFHITMTVCALLTPFLMIGMGAWYLFGSAGEINPLVGYRTPMSQKNILTWQFAQKYVGRLWFPAGLIMTPLSLLVMILVPDGTEDSIGIVVSVVIIVQCIVIFATIIATELALHKHFDKNGNPR